MTSTLGERVFPAAFRNRLALAAAALSFALGSGRSTRLVPASSVLTTTRHLGSSQLHLAVHFSWRFPSGVSVYTVVAAGSANELGGAAGCWEAEHQDGRSPGSSAAVQSSQVRLPVDSWS